MKRKKHTSQQILEKLRTVDVELSAGRTFAEIARKLEVSEQTVHRWRNVYGGMKGPEVARLKELERENVRLKKIVAEQAMDLDVLKEVSRKNGRPGGAAAGRGVDSLRAWVLRASRCEGDRRGACNASLPGPNGWGRASPDRTDA